VQNGGETDVDCGGNTACARCASGKKCVAAADCANNVCTNGICQTSGCADGVKNGTETAIDCGGGACAKCVAGLTCLVANDCQSGVCTQGTCRAPTCADLVKNGVETDIDCGGNTCGKCAAGKGCAASTDCTSGVCSGGTCQAPNCSDGVKNGNESDVDCGGTSTCGRCVTNKTCTAGSDCQSGVCLQGRCQAPTCTDTVKNGTETDVDCGGNNCNRCNDGKSCSVPGDCLNGVCSGNPKKCQAATCVDGVRNGTESDIDCGGITCQGCPDGRLCNFSSDCINLNCANGVCQSSLCQVDEVAWGTTCYYFSTLLTDWNGGEAECEARGMALAAVETGEENAFITQNVPDKSWFGLVNQQTGAGWTWYATGMQLTFTSWAVGQPPTDTSLSCGFIGKDGRWVAQRCTTLMSFVCERTTISSCCPFSCCNCC
jgi:hypothetical protein